MSDIGIAATGQAQALSEEQVADNPSWRTYRSSLERNGYFKVCSRQPANYLESVLLFCMLHSWLKGASVMNAEEMMYMLYT